MTLQQSPDPKLPHHTLVAYALCLELVRLIGNLRIGEPGLRAQARKSAGDKRRLYTIAGSEACEACAAVEIAGALGACRPADVQAALASVVRIRRVFAPLVR